jgi:hypothetical protein
MSSFRPTRHNPHGDCYIRSARVVTEVMVVFNESADVHVGGRIAFL